MKAKPIDFAEPMIRALLEGRKTMTRRVVKWKPSPKEEGLNMQFSGLQADLYSTGVPHRGWVLYSMRNSCWNQVTEPNHSPYGQPGDLLWVREAWNGNREVGIAYKATQPDMNGAPWKSPIFMPQRASRITLRITEVRVERMREITDAGAIAEGVEELPFQGEEPGAWWTANVKGGAALHGRTPTRAFLRYWDSLYTKKPERQAKANPWVWAMPFEVIRANVGDVLTGEEGE